MTADRDSEDPDGTRAAEPRAGRHYGLDWLRIGAFALLILYHVGMYFQPGHWVVKTADPIPWVAWFLLLLAPWRLAVLFVVSGYATRVLLARLGDARLFAAERTRRLIVPLLFGMAVIVPPQSWITLKFNHGYQPGFRHFYGSDYFRFGQLDGVTLPEWEHLWFIFYLWLFTMALLGARRLAGPRLRARIGAAAAGLQPGARLLWLPLLYVVPVRVGLTFALGESHGLFDDWTAYLLYAPVFLFGVALAGRPAFRRSVARTWKAALGLAAGAYALILGVEIAYPGQSWPPHWLMALDRAAMGVMMWSMVIVMLRLADRLLNRDHRWRAPLGEAVFPSYIVHQTAIVLTGWWLRPAGFGPAAEFAVILAATVAACWAAYALGRRVGWFAPLVGMKPRRRKGRAPLTRPAAS